MEDLLITIAEFVAKHEVVLGISTLGILVVGILILFYFVYRVISKQFNFKIWVLVILIVLLLVIAGYVISQQPCWPAKLKLALEVFLVVGFGAIIAILQIKHNQRIANQQQYTTAIEHLSSISPAVRLKGVLDLYERAKVTNDKKIKDEIWKILHDQVRYFTRDKNYQAVFKDKPSGDIQEIIGTLTREEYSKAFDYDNANTYIDWSGAYLVGASFAYAQLQSAIFEDAQLQGAEFWDAQLQSALFEDAKLQGAEFKDAQLQAAHFKGAQLQAAHFWDAQLQGVDFGKVQLQGADFKKAQLQGADFSEAQLQGANFSEAQIQCAHFSEAQLQGAHFWDAQLQGAYFEKAQLQGAHFSEAQLQGAYSAPISSLSFEKVISSRPGKDADMRNTIVKGGLKEAIDEMEKDFDLKASYWGERHKKRLKKLLKELKDNHMGEAERGSKEQWEAVFGQHHANLGKYTKDEAKKWIRKYNKAVGKEEE